MTPHEKEELIKYRSELRREGYAYIVVGYPGWFLAGYLEPALGPVASVLAVVLLLFGVTGSRRMAESKGRSPWWAATLLLPIMLQEVPVEIAKYPKLPPERRTHALIEPSED